MSGKKQEDKKISGSGKPVVILYAKGLMLWAGVLFFSCIWMFTIGLLVGRGTIPVEKGFKKLEEKFFASSGLKNSDDGIVSQVQSVMQQGKIQAKNSRKKFKIYDELVKNKPHESLKVKRVVKKKIPIHKPEVKEDITKEITPAVEENKIEAASSVEKIEKPRIVKKEKKKRIEVTHENVNSKKYSIQVAAYKERKNAEKKVNELNSKGFNAHVHTGESVNGAKWYRVRVGYFARRSESLKMMKKLSGKGYNCFFVNN